MYIFSPVNKQLYIQQTVLHFPLQKLEVHKDGALKYQHGQLESLEMQNPDFRDIPMIK